MTDTGSWDGDTWRRWRLGGLGASDIAAAYSGRYGGAFRVVAERIGIEIPASQRIDPQLAERGHRWERRIAEMTAAGWNVGIYDRQQPVQHPTRPRDLATPDAMLGTLDDPPRLFATWDAKTISPWQPWPIDYWAAQGTWQAHVRGVSRSVIAVATIDEETDVRTGRRSEWIRSLHLRIVDVDQDLVDELVDLADWLWRWVEAGRLPPPDCGDALPWVRAANRHRNPDKVVTLPESTVALLNERDRLRREVAAAQDRLDSIEATIRAEVGDARSGLTPEAVPEQWRVNVGVPRRDFTKASAAHVVDMIRAELDARQSGAEGSPVFDGIGDEDLRSMLRPGLDRDRAAELIPAVIEDARETTPTRSFTVKKLRGGLTQ